MNKKNKGIVVFIVVITIVMLVTVGLSFAFFIATINGSVESETVIETPTLDSLMFSEGNPINLIASQENFGSGAGNRTGSTTSTVTLTTNNKEQVTYCYTATLVITGNDFTYSANSSTPELIVTISKSANGGAFQNILTDYDVTMLNGSVQIPISAGSQTIKHSITGAPNSTVVDQFRADLTFVNLNTDQYNNTGKSFESHLVMAATDC